MSIFYKEATQRGSRGWNFIFGVLIAFQLVFILIGCSPKKLGGNNDVGLTGGGAFKPVRPVYPKNSVLATVRENLPPGTLYIPPEFEKELGTPLSDYLAHNLPVGSTLDVAIEPGVREVGSAQQRSAPLSLYFAIDVTNSMTVNLEAIKANISDLVAKLKAGGLTPKIGLVAFRDQVVETLPATEDVGTFLSVLNRQSAFGGNDAWEASLLGIKQAALLLQQNHQPGNSNAILVVSDNPGHLGSSSNCSIDSIASFLNSFSSEFQKSLHIYGSVRADADGEFEHKPCPSSSGSGLAKDQFEDLLSRSLIAADQYKRGGVLDYPLSSDVILGQLIRIIERTVQGQRKVCLTKSFSILDGSNTVNSWSGLSLAETYGTFVLGEALIWKNALTSDAIQNLRGKNLRAQMDRCCISEDLALVGNFSSCQIKRLQFDFLIDK